MDIKSRDMGLLVALDALLEEQSVSAAAARLGLSQPAMSAQLKRLRSVFDDPLLTPSGRALVPTTRALNIKDDLRRHLLDLDDLIRRGRGFDPLTARRTFRVIGTDYAHAILSSRIAEVMRANAPGCRVAFLPFAPKVVWQMLTDDDADAAFVVGMSLAEAKAARCLSEDFCVIQRKGHPRGSGAFSVEAFCAWDHVLVSPEGGGFVGASDRVLRGTGYQRRVAVSLPNFLLAPSMVAQTDYLCLLPRRLAVQHADRVDLFEAPFEAPEFDLDLFWHPRRQHDPSHVWFRRQLRTLSESM